VNSVTGSGAWHPNQDVLALYARYDLPLTARWRVAWHIKHCSECEQQILLFRSSYVELNREANHQTLTGFEAIADWRRLEREMLGNIAVGVAAARCIENVGRKRTWTLRATIFGALTTLFVIGWMTHIPSAETGRLVEILSRIAGMKHTVVVGTVLQTTPQGIAVRTQDATLTILHPASAVIGVSGSSAVSARYVDDTGQVNIAKVYGQ